MQCGIAPEEAFLGVTETGETFEVPKEEFAGALKYYMEVRSADELRLCFPIEYWLRSGVCTHLAIYQYFKI